MRLEKKNEEMLAKRKGLTGRTIIQTIWLAISFVAAYFFINYLIDQDYISYDQIYNGFSLPRSVPEWAILVGLMLIIVFIMQFILIFGFMISAPEGRRKLGDPTMKSRNKDPFDDHY
jgi:TRAP-type C4-dicarboxylate transport system permease small subunit